MNYDVIQARYVDGYKIWLRFRDGTTGELDLRSALNGPVFKPLVNVNYFKRFRIHEIFHTLVWPNGADIAPEYLYEQSRKTA